MIRVLDAQRGGGDFLNFRLDDDRGSARGASQRGVFNVCNEGDFGGAGLFNALDAGDFEVWIAAEFRAQLRCQFA